MTELLRVSTAEATTTRPDGGSGMMDESGQAVGELVQEYVRLKWKRAGPPVRARTIGQHLGPALRSRIDVLGTDGEQLLEVRTTLRSSNRTFVSGHGAGSRRPTR